MNLLFRHTFLIHQRWTISQQLQLLQTKQLQQQSSAKEEVRDSIFIFLLCGIVKVGRYFSLLLLASRAETARPFYLSVQLGIGYVHMHFCT